MSIENLSTDLDNGINLLNLLEQISGKQVAATYNKNPKMRVQKIENVNFSLNFLTKEGTYPDEFYINLKKKIK